MSNVLRQTRRGFRRRASTHGYACGVRRSYELKRLRTRIARVAKQLALSEALHC